MALDTPPSLRSLVIYEIFVRNHGPHGTFADVIADLPRIRKLGVDFIWLMPIHPIGLANRIGDLGNPYSIRDYREINPEYGTGEDFSQLIERAHAAGLKVMIDVVYHHTAQDAVLLADHPEFYRRDGSDSLLTSFPDWKDVVDLNHPHPGLTQYLIETLQGWAELGVDGFRCDVAAFVPVEFWNQARAAVAKVKPDVVWLAESVHARFVDRRRRAGHPGLSDSQLYSAFDITYSYDIWPIWQLAVQGRIPVRRYIEMLSFQDCIYPENFLKLRYVENHDQARIMRIAINRQQGLAWTAFEAFNKGPFLIYAGQETGSKHTPSLFTRDRIDWSDFSIQPFLARLAKLKKDPAQLQGEFTVVQADPAIQAAWTYPEGNLFGIFNVSGKQGYIVAGIPNGTYRDVLNDSELAVRGGKLLLPESAAILRIKEPLNIKPAYCELLDYTISW